MGLAGLGRFEVLLIVCLGVGLDMAFLLGNGVFGREVVVQVGGSRYYPTVNNGSSKHIQAASANTGLVLK